MSTQGALVPIIGIMTINVSIMSAQGEAPQLVEASSWTAMRCWKLTPGDQDIGGSGGGGNDSYSSGTGTGTGEGNSSWWTTEGWNATTSPGPSGSSIMPASGYFWEDLTL